MTSGPEFDSVLAAAQAGAEWAFAALYRDLNPRLLRYLGAQAPAAGEAVAAGTWLAVARQLASFAGGEGAFRGWLFTIARRRLVQHWRDAGRRPSTPVDPETLAGRAAADDPEASGLAAVSAGEAAAAIAPRASPRPAPRGLVRGLAGPGGGPGAPDPGKEAGRVGGLRHHA